MNTAVQLENREHRSGFVAFVGRPSTGKSTLTNAIMGTKRSIVSPVSQTTRRVVQAVYNGTAPAYDYQLVLVDTPGLHKPQDALGKELNRATLAQLSDVDVVAMLVDATKPVGRGDEWVARQVQDNKSAYKILVITKADKAKPDEVKAQIERASALAHFDDVVAISAKENFNVDVLVSLITEHLPQGPKWFGDDMDCNLTDEELVSEFIREKVLLFTRQEIPHAVAVTCEDLTWRNNHHLEVVATIHVEREGQKAIIIGKGGSLIKKIGIAARKDIETLFGATCYLDLQVRVLPAWRKDKNEIRRFGYDAELS